MCRERMNLTTKTTPEGEELRILNGKIQENRDKHAAELIVAAAQRMSSVIFRDIRKRAEDERAAENLMRKRKREYNRQMRVLSNRIHLCLAVALGVFVSWCLDLVRDGFLLVVLAVCTSIIAFTWGIGFEKEKQFEGVDR